MTRENKLALVVGFGLILLVGILISDHFSSARHEPAAELANVVDPLNYGRDDKPDLLDPRGGAPQHNQYPPASPRNRDRYVPEVTDTGGGVRTLNGGRNTPPPASYEMGGGTVTDAVSQQPQTTTPAVRTHHVASGESMTSICAHYYGDVALINALARYNNMSNPNALSAGRRLRIPDASVLGGTATPQHAAATPPARAAEPEFSTYTVREGDSLSTIAQRLLGSSRRYLDIFELNRDTLPSPDKVREGMVLKIPKAS